MAHDPPADPEAPQRVNPRASPDEIAEERRRLEPANRPVRHVLTTLELAWSPAWAVFRGALKVHADEPGGKGIAEETDILERTLRAYLQRWADDLVELTGRAAEEWLELAWAEREELRRKGVVPVQTRRRKSGAAAEFDDRLGGDP